MASYAHFAFAQKSLDDGPLDHTLESLFDRCFSITVFSLSMYKSDPYKCYLHNF